MLIFYIAGVLLVKGMNGLESPCLKKNQQKQIVAFVDPDDLAAYAED